LYYDQPKTNIHSPDGPAVFCKHNGSIQPGVLRQGDRLGFCEWGYVEIIRAQRQGGIDFWASWCVPCRASNKRLTKLYPKYKDQGFEIFSVSLDDNLEDWKKAIRKDKVSWLQVIDPRGWEAQTARDWNIYALPTSFLIDKSGKLIAMDLEGRELESAVKELLGK
jgi:thiol-disulfide isomerase/thioredoxin